MSLLITCEVGGDAIPHWLAPHLHQLAIKSSSSTRKRGRAKSRTSITAHRKSSRPGTSKLKSRPIIASVHDAWIEYKDLADDSPENSALSKMMRGLRVDRHGIEIATKLATTLKAERHFHRYPIELVDVTKDRKQRRLFSGPFQYVDRTIQHRLLKEIHETYLDDLSRCIERQLKKDGFVVHFSIRTFPLKKQGNIRRTDVGLLYDPSSQDEVDLCMDLVDDMWYRAPMLKVRRNYPRRGVEVGVTRRLRRRFSGSDYVGIELWLNRAWCGRAVSLRDEALEAMTQSLASVTGISESPLDEMTSLYDAA